MLTVVQYANVLCLVVVVVCLVDGYCSEWVGEAYRMTDGKTSVGNLLARAVFLVEWQVCMLSVKLGFHD